MAQYIYTILALFIVVILSMSMMRGVTKNAQEQTLNEAGTLITGVATEVLERIGTTHFDRHNFVGGELHRTDPANNYGRPYCGRLKNSETSTLATPGSFTRCATFEGCRYIEGFHGFTAADDVVLTRAGFPFRIDNIEVEYVDPVTFAPSSAETFAKRVSVTIEAPWVYVAGDPTNTIKLTLDRVFTYGCVTDANLVPYLLAPDMCPDAMAGLACSTW